MAGDGEREVSGVLEDLQEDNLKPTHQGKWLPFPPLYLSIFTLREEQLSTELTGRRVQAQFQSLWAAASMASNSGLCSGRPAPPSRVPLPLSSLSLGSEQE